MRALVLALLASAAGGPALAQHAGHTTPDHQAQSRPEANPAPSADPHAGHDMGMEPSADPHAGHDTGMAPAADPHAGHDMEVAPAAAPPATQPPAAAFGGPRHAADSAFDPSLMAAAREQLRAEQGGMRTYRVMVDQLEARVHDGRDGYLWDGQGWYGGDVDKLWIKTEGEGGFGEELEQAEVQALWSHAITPWFDLQAGLRYDFRPDPERGHLVLGLQGLAPFYLEIDAAAFLSDQGDVTARLEAEHDQLITQKLVLQPRAELEFAAQDVREIGVGAGLSSLEAGLRLRYEFVPELAPYIGVEYERKIGKTADFAKAEGEDAGSWVLLLGIRAWF